MATANRSLTELGTFRRETSAPGATKAARRAYPGVALWLLAAAVVAPGCGDEGGGSGIDAGTNAGADGGGASAADAGSSGPDASIDECAAPDAGIGLPCTTSDDCTCDNACAMGACVSPLLCNEALLNWLGPIENVDGTCLTDLAGFRLYWSTDEATLLTDQTEDLGLPCIAGETLACGMGGETAVQLVCSHRLANLPNGTIYIALSSYNAENLESTPAGPVTKMVSCP